MVVWRLASRYSGDWTILAYTPSDTLLTKTRPFTSARSMRRSTAAPKASRAATTSSRSRPRSRAKWLRVPAGTQTRGTSAAIATLATSACEPSPPAMPITSAPRSIALLRELEQVVPGLEDHRLDAAAAALLDQREPLRLPAAGPRVHDEDAVRCRSHLGARDRLRPQRPAIAAERVADEDGGPGEQPEHDDEAQAVALRGAARRRSRAPGARPWRRRPRAGSSPCG